MKKIVSILLVAVLIMSTVVSTAAYSTDKLQLSVKETAQVYENPDEIETNRYYFLMPDGTNGQKNPYENDAENYGKYVASWYNEYTDTPAVYWEESSIFFPDDNSACSTSVEKGDSDCVFYADVPKSASAIVWSNNVEYSDGVSDPMFAYAMYTISIPCEYYDPGESDNYPDGVDSFDNMIYVLHAPTSSTDRLPSASNEFIGEWYYYYGDGCYSTVENGTVDNCIRDDHEHHNGSEFKYIDKILERFGATEYYEQQAILDVYEEVYYHYSDDNAQEPDWALVLCPLNPAPIEWKYGTLVGDRILSVVGGACAVFPDGYGVYVREIDKFIPLRQSNLEQIVELCPDFIEAIEENEIGQQFGDVDNDGKLSIIDATYIQRFLAKLYDFIQTYYLVRLDGGNGSVSVCDFDGDGDVSILDATGIQRQLAGLDEEPATYGEMIFSDYSQRLRDMPEGVAELTFNKEYSAMQFLSSVYNEGVIGTRNTVVVIKSNEQYKTLFNSGAPEFSDEFFDSNWLVAAFVRTGCYEGIAPISKVAKDGNTLYVEARVFISSDGPLQPIDPFWLSIVSVDKDLLADVQSVVEVGR